MTDAELIEFCEMGDLSPEMQAKFVGSLSPQKRAALERMASLTAEIELWDAGLGPRPAGVFLCGPKQIRGAGRA